MNISYVEITAADVIKACNAESSLTNLLGFNPASIYEHT